MARIGWHQPIGALVLGCAALLVHPACGGGDEDLPTDTDDDVDASGGGSDGQGGDPADGSGGSGDLGGGGAVGTGGSGPLPTSCEEIVCERGECKLEGGFAVCDCLPGFEGPNCDDVNECPPLGTASCGAWGSCTNTFGGYYCSCLPGSEPSGDGCVALDECAGTSPCAAGATCGNSAAGYSCTCSGNYGNGWQCGTPDRCAGNPCGAGATCTSTASHAACACPLGKAGASDCSTSCASLTIADSSLANAIAAAIGKPIDQIVPAVDFVGQTTLLLANKGVTSLDGLECWANLETLDLSGNPLGVGPDATPIEALRSLTRLRELDLGCTSLEDLAPLADHPGLRSLSIVDNSCNSEWTDLSVIEGLHQLEVLELVNLGLPTALIPDVSDLRALRWVDMTANDPMPLTMFAGLPLLDTLILVGNGLTDASALAGATQLRYLDLRFNSLGAASFLSSLTSLQAVSLSSNQVTTVPNLAGLTHLQSFQADHNAITSAANVALGPKLSFVDLSYNEVSSAQPFLDSGFVGTLGLSGNAACGDADAILALRAQGVNLYCQ
ncbi:MAG TPA: hypothetical protein VLC09_11895 [Polyangiaceae bacterium]|nr:hypothetical protein [Polyangiaceae bacterium]